MSRVWFTSDLHIGHGLVAMDRESRNGWGLPWDQDEAACILWHDRVLADNWDRLVHRDDTVWVLGDSSAGGTEATAYALNWISNRPGTKHLVPGNHCPVHPMYRDAHQWMPAYLQVFASVQTFARRKIAGQQVLLSHFPYVGDHTTEERFNQYRLRDYGVPLLHGHTHSTEKLSYGRHRLLGIPGCIPYPGPPQIHVGVDAWEMRPVALDEVAALIEEGAAVINEARR